MKKKLFSDFGDAIQSILVILMLISMFVSMAPFGIMCPKCWEKDHIRSIANRSIEDEKTGDKRIAYRCQYGHLIYKEPESK